LHAVNPCGNTRRLASLGAACALLTALAGCWLSENGSGGAPAALFGAPIATDFGYGFGDLVFGDINGDGRMDVVVRLSGGGEAALLGNGDGTFQTGRIIGGLAEFDAVAIGDLGGDGKPDLAVTGCLLPGCAPQDRMLFVLPGNGDGTFRAPVGYPSTAGARTVAIGDFNSDGHRDVAVGYDHPVVSILLGDADGSLQAPTNWSTESGLITIFSVVAADVNADHKQDLVVFQGGGFLSASVSVLLGHGDGTFDLPAVQRLDQFPQLSELADFNHDGWTDVVVNGSRIGTQPGPGVLTIMLGKGDGTFGSPIHPYNNVVFGAGGYAVGDIDRDGSPDLLMRVSDTDPLLVFYGKGDGTFAPSQEFAPGLDAAPVDRLIDVNGDGRLDLVLGTASGFAVLLGAR